MLNREINSHLRVLVIEDDLAVRRVLRLSLRLAGFATAEAVTGGEALDILKQEPIDAVILDLGLPDGRGGAVLDWLRRRDEQVCGDPAWVVISALDREDAIGRYGCLGSYFLGKPFEMTDLLKMLNVALNPSSDH